jgi:hypothetical protein
MGRPEGCKDRLPRKTRELSKSHREKLAKAAADNAEKKKNKKQQDERNKNQPSFRRFFSAPCWNKQ